MNIDEVVALSIVSNTKTATHRSTLSQAISAGAIALVGLTLAVAQASRALDMPTPVKFPDL